MLTYFLQVNLCWLMFYGLYWALLSRETFFKLNRFYLIISLLCGMIVPFVTEYLSQIDAIATMPIVQMSQPMMQDFVILQEDIGKNVAVTSKTPYLLPIPTGWQASLRGGYFVGVVWVILRFLIGLAQIVKRYREGLKEKNNDFTLIHSNGLTTPFSFFRWIFIDKTLYDDRALGQIMEHEKAHVRQKHSLDIVGIEILRGVFWLSPIIHFYARSIRNVHEYLADAAVLSHRDSFGGITEKKQYGRLLLHQSAHESGLTIAHHFNFSQLKKRITMMTRNRSERKALGKYTLSVPIFVVIIIFLASPKNGLMAKTEDYSEEITRTIDKIEDKIDNPKPLSNVLNLKKNVQTPKVDSAFNPLEMVYFEPFVQLSGATSGTITKEFLHRQTHLSLIQQTYEPPLMFSIKSFKLVRIPLGSEQIQVSENIGQNFNTETLQLIRQAQNGDKYQFVNIKGQYPVDATLRILTDLVFKIAEDSQDLMSNLQEKSKLLNKTSPLDDCGFKYGDTGQMAVFPGGEAEIDKFIYANLRYPEEAKAKKREGLFFISYAVGVDGKITNVHSWKWKWANPRLSTWKQPRIEIETEDQPMIDEAIRVIRSMPRWKPGTRNGVVACQTRHAIIKFQLDN